MNTFLISSKNLQKAIEKAQGIIKENKIDKFDIELLEPEQALGIEEVRSLQKKIFLKPLRGEKKAIIINLTNGATIEAQNSMLKLLEEPPASTLIFLLTNNAYSFLPTILSRVKTIEIKEEETSIDSEGLKEISSLTGVGQSLFLAQVISKDKEGAISWLESAILAAREEMIERLEDKQEALKYRKIIHKLELTHYDLKTTNVNPRLALEDLFLNI